MKNEISVLITSAGTIATDGVIQHLKNNYEKRKVRVVCCDFVDQPVMHYKVDSFHLLPLGNSKKYINSLIDLCIKEKIDVVLPRSSNEVFAIAKNIDILKSKNIEKFLDFWSFNSVEKSISTLPTKIQHSTHFIFGQNFSLN